MGRRKRQKGGVFPFGLIASAAAPLVGEIVKPIFKKKLLVGVEKEEEDDEGNNSFTKKHYTETLGRLLWLDMKEQVDDIYSEM